MIKSDQKEWIEAYSPETESTVLACMLNTEEQFHIAKDLLTSADFFREEHQKIFHLLIKAYEKNQAIDFPIFISYCNETQNLSEEEYSYLFELNHISDKYQNLENYCNILKELSNKRLIVDLYKNGIKNLKEGYSSTEILKKLIDTAHSMKRKTDDTNTQYDHLLKKISENDIVQEIKNISQGARVGMQIGSVDLKIPGGALSIIAGPTGHGKTLLLINMILNYLSIYPEKSVYFFSFEESRASILSLFLNTFINENISKNNRESIKSYLIDGNLNYINKDKRDVFIEKKNHFFKSLIESRRLNIFYSDYSSEELCNAIDFLKRNTNAGMICVDYMQFLKLENRKTMARQEELKNICLLLKDCAVETGLPLLIAAQFNRSVVNEATISPVAIGEAGDIERAANTIIGIWNRNYTGFSEEGNRGKDKKPIPQESALYLEILKSRETGTGHYGIFDLDGNTGKLLHRKELVSKKRKSDGKQLWE